MNEQYTIRFPRFGTVTLLSMWQKGKKGNNVRFLVEEGDGTKRFLWLQLWGNGGAFQGHPFYGKKEIEYTDYDYCKIISPVHVKNKNYNYYHLTDDCATEFEQMLADYEASNPLVAETLTPGPAMHVDYSRVNYKLWEKI